MNDWQHKMVGIGACRLAAGEIHLGHYNGCLRPDKLMLIDNLVFIIQDNSYLGTYSSEAERSVLVKFLSQLYSIPIHCGLNACLQTGIFANYAKLLDIARRLITVSLLETTNPKKSALAGKQTLYLQDYLFPLDQAIQILATRASYVLMNDDNLRAVRFTRKICRRLSTRGMGLQLVLPELLTGSPPRLFGFDGRKMSRGNENAIYFLDSLDMVRRSIRKYLHPIFKQSDHVICTSDEESNPVISLLQTVTGYTEDDAKTRLLTYKRDYLEDFLVDKIWSIISPVQQQYREMVQNATIVLRRFMTDQEQVNARISAVLSSLIDGLDV